MHLKRKTEPKKQQGSALVVAIFVIVVLGLLVSVLSRLVSTSSDSTVIEVLGNRAFMAAQSGVQVGMVELFPLGSDIADCSAVNDSTVTYSNGGLAQCRSEIVCNAFNYSGGDTHYRLESTGTCEAGNTVTTRKVAIEARTVE